MITVFPAVATDSLIKQGAAFNSPCAKCHNAVLPYCVHEVSVSTINYEREAALLAALTQESINGVLDKSE